MRNTIRWEMAGPTRRLLNVKPCDYDRFVRLMSAVFKHQPWDLDTGQLLGLQLLSAAWTTLTDADYSPFVEIINIIKEHGPIQVWEE